MDMQLQNQVRYKWTAMEYNSVKVKAYLIQISWPTEFIHYTLGEITVVNDVYVDKLHSYTDNIP